jgi:23S rRNA pseudouridine2457 synthase
VYAAGRLDQDSEGLLLLSDDGALIHRLTDPRHHLPKTYLAQVEGVITPEALAQLQQGVTIAGGYHTLGCQAWMVPEPELPPRPKPTNPHAPPSWVRIVLKEGKKRQVRHMTAAVGFPTLRLVRVAIGALTLEGLAPGQWRALNNRDLDLILEGFISQPKGRS